MLIELPIAALKGSSNQDLANKFIQFVKSAPEQEVLRAVRLPAGEQDGGEAVPVELPGRALSTIDNKTIGGWRTADKKWFDPSNGLMVKIEQAVGGPTA